MFISHLFYSIHFFNKNCAWISLDFLVQKKNLDNFVDYLGYYKNYFGSTAEWNYKQKVKLTDNICT